MFYCLLLLEYRKKNIRPKKNSSALIIFLVSLGSDQTLLVSSYFIDSQFRPNFDFDSLRFIERHSVILKVKKQKQHKLFKILMFVCITLAWNMCSWNKKRANEKINVCRTAVACSSKDEKKIVFLVLARNIIQFFFLISYSRYIKIEFCFH